MIDLSLCMIVKNEEHNLERCLQSVEGLVNEIIILDTGSTDRTIELAKRLNANVYVPEQEIVPFSFAKARNIALRYALGKWILHLDADEELSNTSIDFIREALQGDQNIAYIATILNKLSDGSEGKFESIRLFTNHPHIRYTRDCHEEISFSLHHHKYKLEQSPIEIIHHGYCAPQAHLDMKAYRNLNILTEMFNKNPNWLTAFQIAESYLLLEKPIYAKAYFRHALKQPTLPDNFRTRIIEIMQNI